NKLFALEAVDLESRRTRPVEGRESRLNRNQPPQRATVVVHVVAHHQPLGQPIQPLRFEQQRPNHDGIGRVELSRGFESLLLHVHSALSMHNETRRAWTLSSNGVSALTPTIRI